MVHASAGRLSLPFKLQLVAVPHIADRVVVEATQIDPVEISLVVLKGHPEISVIAVQSVIQFFLY